MSPDMDAGPFFHGTRAELTPGDLLTAGHRSNYRPEVVMNHVYFTALRDGAGLAAEIAVMLAPGDAEPHVYRVEPSGEYEDDPNVTDTKFPGNPTRSFRTVAPMIVVEEIHDWTPLTPEVRETWRRQLATMLENDAEIIN